MTTRDDTNRDRPLAEAGWLTLPETRAVFAALDRAGFEARAVGGSVRNALLGLPVADVDIATPARPEDVVAAARAAGLAAHPTGIDHGTVTVVSGRVPHEVTTLRRDVETDGRRAVIAFATDWAEDAARRDFTINALYADPDGRVHDPLGTGLRDLAARRVRFIGDADARIREDYLRILRFFRFSAFYGAGTFDAEALAACARNRSGIARLSAERIEAETRKIFTAPPAPLRAVVDVMLRQGFLVSVFGAAPYPGRLDRWLELEPRLPRSADPMARLAALFLAGSNDVARIASRLRLSTADRHRLASFAAGLELAHAPRLTEHAARAALYRFGPDSFRDRTAFAWLQSGDAVSDMRWRDAVALPDRWTPPRMPVAGADAIAAGATPGPSIGRALARVESAWIDSDFTLDRDRCLARLHEILRDPGTA